MLVTLWKQRPGQTLLNHNPMNEIRPRLSPGAKWEILIEKIRQVTPDAALKLLEGDGVELGPQFFLEKDKEIRREKARYKDLFSKYSHLLGEYEELDKMFSDSLLIEKNISPLPVKVTETGDDHEATAIASASDWHCGETVRKEQVHGMNEYNPEVARRRANKFAVNLVKLVEKERKSLPIHNLVLFLGGDFIGGYIHPELEQTNSMTPVQETQFASELLISSIDYILANGGFKRVILLMSVGNHGRTTKKMQFANLVETSYETLIYDNIAKAFRNDERVEINFPESGIGYQEVYGHTVRFYHGHQVRYKDGVGGLTIPLNKKQAKWDKTRKADLNLMGHWHSFGTPNNNTILNGSLKGIDAYAMENGFDYQPPVQAFTLIDSKYGRTVTCPIFCD